MFWLINNLLINFQIVLIMNAPWTNRTERNQRENLWRIFQNFQYEKSRACYKFSMSLLLIQFIVSIFEFSNLPLHSSLAPYNRFVVLSLLSDLQKHFSRPFAWKLFLPFYLSFGSLGIVFLLSAAFSVLSSFSHFLFSSHLCGGFSEYIQHIHQC